MWKSRREFACLVLVTTLAIATLSSVAGGQVEDHKEEAAHGKSGECDQNDLSGSCPLGERCVLDKITGKATCVCRRDYARDPLGGKCVSRPPTHPPAPETTTEKLNGANRSSGSSVAVGLLVPTFLIGLGILGFCIARRYRLLPCRRNLYGNVLVTRDDDDDDPPIA